MNYPKFTLLKKIFSKQLNKIVKKLRKILNYQNFIINSKKNGNLIFFFCNKKNEGLFISLTILIMFKATEDDLREFTSICNNLDHVERKTINVRLSDGHKYISNKNIWKMDKQLKKINYGIYFHSKPYGDELVMIPGGNCKKYHLFRDVEKISDYPQFAKKLFNLLFNVVYVQCEKNVKIVKPMNNIHEMKICGICLKAKKEENMFYFAKSQICDECT